MGGDAIVLADAETDGGRNALLMEAAIRLGGRGGPDLHYGAGALVVGEAGEGFAVLGRGVAASGHGAALAALRAAGASARGATLYVTIEPSLPEEGSGTEPDAILAAGLRRVVSALDDPRPDRAGLAVARLRAGGIAVDTGLCAPAARRLHDGLVSLARNARPHVTLKLAVSADGMIGRRSGERMLVSGEAAFRRLQALRLGADATLIGIETALVNDPRLTVRLPGLLGRSPLRVVLDGTARLPVASALVASIPDAPLLLAVGPEAETSRRAALAAAGAMLFTAPMQQGRLDIKAVLHHLGTRGIGRLLVEGGARVASSLVGQGLADAVVLFRAPVVVGPDGIRALAGGALSSIERSPRYRLVETARLGEDRMLRYERTL